MKKRFVAVLLGVAALAIGGSSAANASANAFLFGYTYNASGDAQGTQDLVLNGSTVINTGFDGISTSTTGWYDNSGLHGAGNPDYIVGNCSINNCGGRSAYNDYFVFDLTGVTGPVTSAQLDIYNPGLRTDPYLGYNGAPNATFSVWDVSTSISALMASQVGAVGTYNDLGSGVFYGSTGVSFADNGAYVVVTLNGAALAALNAAIANGQSQFAFGGSLGFLSVPEPGTLALLGAGLAGLGAFRRRRKASKARGSK